MNGVIKAHEVQYGHKYRLFPNRLRSQYLEVTPVRGERSQIVFECYDPRTRTTREITNVDAQENVIRVA